MSTRRLTRQRATKAEMLGRRLAIMHIVAGSRPTSVRHTYYSAVAQHLVQKDSGGSRSNYAKVQRAVLNLRREGFIGYSDIVDPTRWLRKPTSYSDVDKALEDWQRTYRRDLWADQGTLLECWCESESIAGVLLDVTARWDVPLLPTHGYTSETFAWAAADNYLNDERTPAVLYIGDLDLHGKRIEADLRRKLEGFFGDEVWWQRVGLTLEQVEEHGLQGMTTRAGHWEAEALPPSLMRAALEAAIREYVPEAAPPCPRGGGGIGASDPRGTYEACPLNRGSPERFLWVPPRKPPIPAYYLIDGSFHFYDGSPHPSPCRGHSPDVGLLAEKGVRPRGDGDAGVQPTPSRRQIRAQGTSVRSGASVGVGSGAREIGGGETE